MMEVKRFGWEDYSVFGSMLIVSMLIGLYHGLAKGGSGSHSQFLTAGGQLSVLPVSLSMLASFLSSITLMGQPSEIYLYGPQQWLFGIACFVMIPLVGYVMVPFFRKNNHYSAYQYFGERFSRQLQMLASLIFSVQMVVYLALVLYAPALAMQQVTGINTMLIVTVMYIVCIVYTTVGGIKAVVWTDTFQVLVLFVAVAAVLVKGTIDIGGVAVVWERNQMYNRTVLFNWDFDPTVRYSAWSSFLGAACLHISTYGGNQLQIQRYLTVGTTAEARKMLWINAVGWTFVVFMTTYTGLLIFATYYDCDPLAVQKITKPDQLFPLYVMDALQIYPGFPGLFICGIFSAGLSTVSTGINSLAAIWYAELQGTQFLASLSERKTGLAVKAIALMFGIVSYAVVYLVPYMGNLVPFAITLSSIFAGSLFGLFALGIFFSKANSWGAATGLVTSVALLSWITISSLLLIGRGVVLDRPLPTSISGCHDANATRTHEQSSPIEPDGYSIYRLSYMWYCPVAIVVTVVVGMGVSLLTDLVRKCFVPEASGKPPYYCGGQDVHVDNLLLNEDSKKCVPVTGSCRKNYV